MTKRAEHRPLYARLWFQVIVGVVAGVVLGYLQPTWGAAMRPLGDGFVKLIRMMIAPIIFGTVVVGIGKMGDMKEVGRIGLRALVYFEVVSTVALVLGLVAVNVLKPGAGVNAVNLDAKAVATYTQGAAHLTTVDFLMNIIPTTIVDAFAKGDILEVLFFSVLFGMALLHMGPVGKSLVNLIDQITRWVIERAVRERLAQRDHADAVVSDARLKDYKRLCAGYESPTELKSEEFISVNTAGAVDEIFCSLMNDLAVRHAHC